MMNATKAEQTARARLATRKTNDLINDFILTGKNNNPYIPIVRGWIMDELEKRNSAAFEAWLDDEACTDESIRKYYIC